MKTWIHWWEQLERLSATLKGHEVVIENRPSMKSTGYLDHTYEMLERTAEGVDRACMEFAQSEHFPPMSNEEKLCVAIRVREAQAFCHRLTSAKPGRMRAQMIRPPDPKLATSAVWRWLLVDAWYDFLGTDYLHQLELKVLSGWYVEEHHVWHHGFLPKSAYYSDLLDGELYGNGPSK